MREIGVVKSFKEVGKIKWFGGFNNQTGQINDYGFVECQLENKHIIQKIGNVINAASNEERIILIDRLPDGVKYKEPILQSFHFLLPEDQIRLVWSFIADGSLFIWHYLSREAKILCVYRLAK